MLSFSPYFHVFHGPSVSSKHCCHFHLACSGLVHGWCYLPSTTALSSSVLEIRHVGVHQNSHLTVEKSIAKKKNPKKANDPNSAEHTGQKRPPQQCFKNIPVLFVRTSNLCVCVLFPVPLPACSSFVRVGNYAALSVRAGRASVLRLLCWPSKQRSVRCAVEMSKRRRGRCAKPEPPHRDRQFQEKRTRMRGATGVENFQKLQNNLQTC